MEGGNPLYPAAVTVQLLKTVVLTVSLFRIFPSRLLCSKVRVLLLCQLLVFIFEKEYEEDKEIAESEESLPPHEKEDKPEGLEESHDGDNNDICIVVIILPLLSALLLSDTGALYSFILIPSRSELTSPKIAIVCKPSTLSNNISSHTHFFHDRRLKMYCRSRIPKRKRSRGGLAHQKPDHLEKGAVTHTKEKDRVNLP